MPGKIGAGKTTLTCWLLAHGFGYLSDEFVYIPSEDFQLSAFPRPLNVKVQALDVVRPLFQNTPSGEPVLDATSSGLVPPEYFTDQEIIPRAATRMFVIPDYEKGSEFHFELLPSAGAGMALMKSILNIRNLPEHGMAIVARLVESVPVYRLTYGTFLQLSQNNFLDLVMQDLDRR